jgi:hypothetical protein
MPRKKRGPSPRVPAKPPGGAKRTEAEIQRLLDATEHAMLYRMGRVAIGRVLQEVLKSPDPFPLRTVDDYMRKVRERWEAESKETRGQVKELAIRRIYKTMQAVVATKDFKTLLGWDQHLSRIQGTLAPLAIEATGAGGAPLVPRTGGDVLDELKKLVETLGEVVEPPDDPKAKKAK